MSVQESGRYGEDQSRQLLVARGFKVFQADWIALKDGRYYVVESKHQERYKAPPFDGHGLPPYQVKARLDFQRQTGIHIIFLVLDKHTKEFFVADLAMLEKGEHIDTTKNPRRIYPLSAFHVFPPLNEEELLG